MILSSYYLLLCFQLIAGAPFAPLMRYWHSRNPPVSYTRRPTIFESALRGFRSAFNGSTFPSVPNLIRSDGYPVEIHHVVTTDDYIIELHRIPSKSTFYRKNKDIPVVLMGHCLFCGSDTFVVGGKGVALGYLMSDIGYDVWMLNARGNSYSTNHRRLSTDSRKFWDFSWDEIGLYDLPASIDYIIEQTNVRQIDYIGYSMGTTIFFVLMSERPEYNKKVRRMAALAPSVYGSYLRGPFSVMSPFLPVTESLERSIPFFEVPPKALNINQLTINACRSPHVLRQAMCNLIFIAFQGGTPKNVDRTLLTEKFLKYFPNTGSLHTITHYHQRYNTGKFQKFDHGENKNIIKYGRSNPSEYNLTRVTVKLGLFWSEVDGYTSPRDIQRLKKELPSPVYEYTITDPDFEHANFVWDKDVVEKLYLKVLKFMIT